MLTKEMAKKEALRWLDEATLNGQDAGVELTADYTDKFNYFLHNVLVYIAAQFKLPAVYNISEETEAEDKGAYWKYILPDDFMELEKIVGIKDDEYFEITEYKTEGVRAFLLPKSKFKHFDSVEFDYWKLPEDVPFNADETTVLEVQPKAEQLVGLRLAIEATAGSDETSGISYYLDGKFSNMLVNLLGEPKGSINNSVERVYAI